LRIGQTVRRVERQASDQPRNKTIGGKSVSVPSAGAQDATKPANDRAAALEQLLARERQRVNELEQRLAEIVKDERVWRDAATGEKAQAEAARARAEDALRRAVLSEEAARAQAVEATRRAEGDQLNARAAAEDAARNAERAARRRASTADE